MAGPDRRLVQTAVIGSAASGLGIVLPQGADELRRLRRRHPAYTYWCGTQLGGCGGKLADRLYADKVCHFAHAPNASCHRRANGTDSADHLFVKQDLARWARGGGIDARAVLRDLGSGPGDAVDFRVRAGRQRVRFQFRKLSHPEWSSACEELERDAASLDWVFGPGSAHPETVREMREAFGHVLRFRFETQGVARHVRIRAEEARRSTDWVPLDACAMTPEGLRVPGARRLTGTSRRPVAVEPPPVPSPAAPAPRPAAGADRRSGRRTSPLVRKVQRLVDEVNALAASADADVRTTAERLDREAASWVERYGRLTGPDFWSGKATKTAAQGDGLAGRLEKLARRLE
ncbi:competence protein CoiA family protein [Streptomyces sp. NPDC007164]|uniref:competence protein CoiA family protein n=1 Tax=Streptomyces sp. NPDC007164 TaxID=3156918 RepID=UPI00340C866D